MNNKDTRQNQNNENTYKKVVENETNTKRDCRDGKNCR